MEAVAAWGEWEADAAVPAANPGGGGNLLRHIKKRALKNKALSVSFNEKDLKDFVTGFHKRKKKRRKIAQRQIEEKDRRKRIEIRKQRKLERESSTYPGASSDEELEKNNSGSENDEKDLEPDDLDNARSISGTRKYENSDLTVTVRTSEISRREDEADPRVAQSQSQSQGQGHGLRPVGKRGVLPPKKKPMKRSGNKRKKRVKSESKRKKGAKKGRKR